MGCCHSWNQHPTITPCIVSSSPPLHVRLKLTDKASLDRSLSRSGKKVLHVDRHSYYGGDDAGLSLQDVESWVQELDEGIFAITTT